MRGSLALWTAGALAPAVCVFAAANPATTTVPMQVELGRPYIDVMLTGPNGRPVTAHAYIDTGGGALLFSAGLATQLGLQATGAPTHEEGQAFAPTAAPALRIGDTHIDIGDTHAFIVTDAPDTLVHSDARMMLPGRALARNVAVFDYPAHTFTVANPRGFKPDGAPVHAAFGGGMPVVRASVAGKAYDFLLDTGGQYTMVSIANLGAWRKQHPDWPHVAGAYGPANMLLGKPEAQLSMLRIAAMQWGPFRIDHAGAVSRAVGNYERFMSGVVGMPIIGSIGGNVLRHYKVTIDYPAGKIYVAGPAQAHDEPLDMVGVTLEPAGHGGYDVAAVVPGVHGIKPGDRLLSVSGRDVTGLPFARVIGLLSGTPGEKRALVIERGGARATVKATVQPVFQGQTSRTLPHVNPAQAGIHFGLPAPAMWIPAFAGMTGNSKMPSGSPAP